MKSWIATLLAALAVIAVMLLIRPGTTGDRAEARPVTSPATPVPVVAEIPTAAAAKDGPAAPVAPRPAIEPAGSDSITSASRTVPAPSSRPKDTAPADTAGTLVDGRWPARYWSPGRPARPSPLEHAPGYTKLDDPEAEATITGHRQVGPTNAQLQGGAASATELAQFLLDCMNRNDYRGLRDLQITFEEFRDILWPEFPQSRPATHVSAEEAWEVLLHSSVTGARRALGEWANQDLTFDSLTFTQGWTPYTNFNLYLGVRIHARTAAGESVEIKYADGFAERNGQWKVYIYRD